MNMEDDQKFEIVSHFTEQERLAEDYKKQTVAFIEEKKTLAAQMGANDAEIGQLENLKELFIEGRMTDREARERAEQILNSKNDYH